MLREIILLPVAMVLACGAPPLAKPAAEDGRITLAMAGVTPRLQDTLAADMHAGVTTVESYFGAPFPEKFVFRVFPNRAALEAHWGAKSGEPGLKTECWMVGMGLSDELSILSPERWPDQACEHSADDHSHIAKLITHELVHTYHSQINAVIDKDNEAAAALGWFVEGVATFVSGQLTDGHLLPASDAIENDAAPRQLSEAWTGKYKYGVSGSLVAYIDATWGRRMVRRLLDARTPKELLGMLGVDEPTLLARWRMWVLAQR